MRVEYFGANTKVGDYLSQLKPGSYGLQTPGGGFSINKADKSLVPIQTTTGVQTNQLSQTIKQNLPVILGGVGILVFLMVLKK